MKIEIATEDGVCPAHVVHPSGDGPRPGVLMFMDGLGMRPALVAIAERLGAAGYYVLLPDLFYRAGAYEPADPKQIFTDPAVRAAWMTRFITKASTELIMRDTRAFLEHFADHGLTKIGATGYCMGGRMALNAAAHFPDRIAAVAAFHPGNLANDAPDSPHLLASRIKARIYVAAASDDPSFPDEQRLRLDQALSTAGVDHVIETYPARHGWVPSDTPVHDPACAERHWTTLLDLLAKSL